MYVLDCLCSCAALCCASLVLIHASSGCKYQTMWKPMWMSNKGARNDDDHHGLYTCVSRGRGMHKSTINDILDPKNKTSITQET